MEALQCIDHANRTEAVDMTTRMGYMLAGLAGVAIVVGLALIGTDLRRAADTGPRWRRRLVAAALVLLGAVGLMTSVTSIEKVQVSCYAPQPMDIGASSLRKLVWQVEQLRKLAESGKVDAAVVQKVIERIEPEIATLSDEDVLERMEFDKIRQRVPRTIAEAQAVLAQIKTMLAEQEAWAATDLQDTPQWQAIVAAWRVAVPMAAASGRGTLTERQVVFNALNEAHAAVRGLCAADRLSEPEGALLRDEMDVLSRRIAQTEATDSPLAEPQDGLRIMCYETQLVYPGAVSLRRLSARLPMLQNLAESGNVNGLVMQKVIGTIEADLAKLSDEAVLKQMPDDETRAKARRTASEIKSVLAAIRKPMSP
jgi:hypothetical protein